MINGLNQYNLADRVTGCLMVVTVLCYPAVEVLQLIFHVQYIYCLFCVIIKVEVNV